MFVSPTVLALLAGCWLIPAVVAVLAYVFAPRESEAPQPRDMDTSIKGIRADIQRLDLRAPRQDWRREDWDGPGARIRAQVQNSSHEVMMLTPYAEASVTVGLDGEPERRRCSLCLN